MGFLDGNYFENAMGYHGDQGRIEVLNFADYLNSLELGIVPNVLPNDINSFFSNRNR